MSWEYSDKEYIKLFRKMTRWEWYTDVNTCHLFMHCLIKANWKDGSWRGIKYKRGQFITSLKTLSKETGLSMKSVRTALKHLEETNEVANLRHSNFRLITVLNYDLYQGEGQTYGQTSGNLKGKPWEYERADLGQTSGNRYKNNKNNKEDEEDKYMASPDENPDDDQLDAEYEEDEDEYAGYVIPQKDEDGNWIDPEW